MHYKEGQNCSSGTIPAPVEKIYDHQWWSAARRHFEGWYARFSLLQSSLMHCGHQRTFRVIRLKRWWIKNKIVNNLTNLLSSELNLKQPTVRTKLLKGRVKNVDSMRCWQRCRVWWCNTDPTITKKCHAWKILSEIKFYNIQECLQIIQMACTWRNCQQHYISIQKPDTLDHTYSH